MNAAGFELLKHYEGFRDSAYRDMVGVWTIGYGFTDGVKEGDTITRAEADERLKEEVANFERGVQVLLLKQASENQLAAMTSLAFNIGLGNFTKSTVLREHNRGDWPLAGAAFLNWVKAGGVIVPGLVKRREAERRLYIT